MTVTPLLPSPHFGSMLSSMVVSFGLRLAALASLCNRKRSSLLKRRQNGSSRDELAAPQFEMFGTKTKPRTLAGLDRQALNLERGTGFEPVNSVFFGLPF